MRYRRVCRTAMAALAFALVLLTNGCTRRGASPSNEVNNYPTAGTLFCTMDETDIYEVASSSTTSGAHAGTSVALLSYGLSNLAPDSMRLTALGAPDGSAGRDMAGMVILVSGNMIDGSFSTYPIQEIGAPSGWADTDFGWSVLGTDMRDCYDPTGGTATNTACGEELIAGAPGSTKGAIYWFYSDPTSWLSSEPYQLGGRIAPPAGAAAGARFGYAIAAPFEKPDPSDPWEVDGYHPSWIAVGAPGIDRVFIYDVQPGASSPLTHIQTLATPPIASGKGYGSALAVGDFSGDGFPDLAVGAPNGNTYDVYGRVFVYQGTSSGSTPFPYTPIVAYDSAFMSSSGSADSFGAALAAGKFIGGHLDRDALMVGAPDHGSTDTGGICQFSFEAGSPPSYIKHASHWCIPNPSGIANEHYGKALAVGNFAAFDAFLDDGTTEALTNEVAVGVPGYASDTGKVIVYSSSNGGIPLEVSITTMPPLIYPVELLEIEEYGGTQVGAEFGSAVAAGYVQTTIWEDLLVGSPEHGTGSASGEGAATVTKAWAPGEGCQNLIGTWEGVDADGDTFQAKVNLDTAGSVLVLQLQNLVDLDMVDGSGNMCRVGDVDLEFQLGGEGEDEIEVSWPCTSGSHTESFTVDYATSIDFLGDITISIDGALAYDSTSHTLEFSLDESTIRSDWAVDPVPALVAGCTIVPNPIELNMVATEACE